MSESERWVAIGRLHGVRGNRGELIGELDSQEPGREEKLSEVVLEVEGRRGQFRVEAVWRNPSIYRGAPVFKFEGIDSISAAEPWERAEILVRESDVIKPGEGEYSYADLVGSRVVRLDAGGAEIGIVDSVEEYGGPPLLRVIASDGREILIPFAREICREVDPASKSIRVVLPEGLTEL